MLGIHDGVQPNLSYLEKELGPKQPADDLYLRKFVIYLISSIFAPTTGIKVSPKCYPFVMNATSVSTLNWAKFIIDILIQTANAKDKKNWFKACMPYLMIVYVDSLETNSLDVPGDGTRCCVWSNCMISLVAGLDTNNDGSFGRLPLKPCFRTNLSLFTTERTDVDMFIKRHLPANHTDEDLSKYRPAVINMCYIFEDGLAKFINSLGKADDKGITNNQVEEEVAVLRNIQMDKPKRRRRTKVSEHAVAAQTSENSCHEQGDLQRDDQVPQNQEASPNAMAEKPKKRKYVAGLGGQRAAKKLVPVSNVDSLQRSDQGADHSDEAAREKMELPHVASNVSVTVDATTNALNQLQFYGTPSQTSNDTIEKDQPAQHTPSTVHVQLKDELQKECTSGIYPGRTSSGKKRKSIIFDIEEKDMQINTNYTDKGGEHHLGL
ncbi:uncharacterized protein [Lolium perenne]|uniref:uncharacterized protein n=1 Tax=Lolium perenne TaxID=4522 RepID=UPI003A99AEAE